MAYFTIEKIESQIRQNDFKFWKIFNSNGRDLIAQSPQQNDLTVDKSIDLLNNNLEGLTGDYVIITASDKSNEERKKGGDNMSSLKMYLKLDSPGTINAGLKGDAALLPMYLQLMQKSHEDRLEFEREKWQRSSEEGINGAADGLADKILNKVFDSPELTGAIAGWINSQRKGKNTDPEKESNLKPGQTFGELEATIRKHYSKADELANDFITLLNKSKNAADELAKFHGFLKMS